MEFSLWFYLLLFVVAMLYASVGHGGASGYIAVMTLFSLSPETIRPLALLLNIGVSLFAFYRYYKSGHFKWELFWPFIIASVPFAFLGGRISLQTHVFHMLLGILLIFPVIHLLGLIPQQEHPRPLKVFPAIITGAVIGLLSGLIGIGGGILLSPFLLLTGWASIKESAAVSALFIFVNSFVVFIAMGGAGAMISISMLPVITIVYAGGLLGAQLGAFAKRPKLLKQVLAIVLLIAAAKLIFV